jgi:tetratricopeptide (TPR) repeat protein
LLVWVAVFTLLPSAHILAEPDWEPAIHRIVHHSMDETFNIAHALADSLLALHPTRPEPWFYKATVYWRQGMNVRDGNKYDQDILTNLERTIEVTETWIKHNGETAEMFLWLGNAYGLRTGLRMLRKEVFKGVIDGIEGRGYLDEAMDLDPELTDANFGIGLSDYILSRNPSILRAVQRLFDLPSGDRKGGLRRLDNAITHGRYNRVDAQSARAYLDLYYEMDALGAQTRLLEMLAQYPNSLDYRIRYVDTMLRLQMEHGHNLAQAMVDSTASIHRIAYSRKWSLFRWREIKLTFVQGIGHFLLGNHERAAALLQSIATRSRDGKNWLVGPAELTLGKLADLKGDREAARTHYQRAERRDDVWGSHDEARRYQVKPYAGKEPESRPIDTDLRYPGRP